MLEPVRFTDSITTQLLKVIFGLYLMVAIALTIIQMYVEYADVKKTINQELKAFSQTAGPGIIDSLWTINDQLLLSILVGIHSNPTVTGVQVREKEGQTYIAVGAVQNDDGQSVFYDKKGGKVDITPLDNLFSKPFEYSFPIVYVGVEGVPFNIGKVTVYSNNQVVIDRVEYGFFLIVINSIIKTLALWFIFIFFLRKLLGRPLQELTNGIGKVNFDNLENSHVDVNTPKGNEISALANTFNGMIDELFHAAKQVKQTEIELSESEEQFRGVFEESSIGMTITDPHGRFIRVNNAFSKFIGHSSDELLNMSIMDITHPDDLQKTLEDRQKLIEGAYQSGDIEKKYITKNGGLVWGRLNRSLVNNPDGTARYTLGQIQDITERKLHEETLRQSQKMEAVGQLTGGIAHDFNNLMGVIIGNAELLKGEAGENDKARQNAEAIIKAVDRGASLTGRLLAFSRQQALSPKPTAINDLVLGLEDMLQRTLGETIELRTHLEPETCKALIDPHQLENALINLSINARDAMPQGGSLTIETANVNLGETYCEHNEEVTPGDYVRVSVSDTGTGIPPEVLGKVFEPFFTTKGVGEGSGLGLSMVYGFAKQSGGHITVYSEEDHGTTVKLYMPRSKEDVARDDTRDETPVFAPGSERILVVEDNKGMREISVITLQDQGYEIVEASDGKEAIRHLQDDQPFDLLFTDIILPGDMNGAKIADEAKRIQPNIKVLYTTGYAENTVIHNEQSDQNIINKPYRRVELLEKVRAMLDSEDG